MSDPIESSAAPRGAWNAISEIIAGLRGRPEYLLVFAAILLYFIFCIYLVNAGLNQGQEWLSYLAIAGFMVGILATVFTVRFTFDNAGRQRQLDELKAHAENRESYVDRLETAIESADQLDVNLPDEELRTEFTAIISNVRKALDIKSRPFQVEIKRDLRGFRKETARWAEGVLVTGAGDYERILLHLYANAQSSVFATSQLDYMEFWSKPGGDNVIEAHRQASQQSGCKVTRVFLFDKLDRVSGEYLDVMRRHSTEPFIQVRVLIADEVRDQSYAQKLMKDFVIIDADTDCPAIGVTESFSVEGMRASWTFGRDEDIEESAESIMQLSMPFARLDARLNP